MMMNLDPLPRPTPHRRQPSGNFMQKVRDPFLWGAIFTYKAFGYDLGAATALRKRPDFQVDDLLVLPGVHVKAGFVPGKGFTWVGQLVKFLGDDLVLGLPGKHKVTEEVVVISTLDRETVWFGTTKQYFKMWCVD